MKEILQNESLGLSIEGEKILEGFVYEDATKLYDDDFVHTNLDPIVECLNNYIEYDSSLELGSGSGTLAWIMNLKKPNNKIVCLDINKDIKHLKYYNNVDLFITRTDEFFKLTENNNDYFKFDLILSFEHFEHITPDKLPVLAANLLNHSKPGTIFFGSAPSYLRGNTPAGAVHPNCKSEYEWDVWFHNLGFDRIDFSILNNREKFNIPPFYYMSSTELLYMKR